MSQIVTTKVSQHENFLEFNINIDAVKMHDEISVQFLTKLKNNYSEI